MNRVLVLAGLILLAGGVMGCAGKGATGLEFEELKQRLERPSCPGLYLWAEDLPEEYEKGLVGAVKERLGEPYKEQLLGRDYYLYYYVREGTAQIIVSDYHGGSPNIRPPSAARGMGIKAINLL